MLDKRHTHPQETIDRLSQVLVGMQKELNEVEQTLGRALGYPRYCDDQENFPGTTDADGVCTGDHTAVTLAMEAAARISKPEDQLLMSR